MRESILEKRLVREVEKIGGLSPKWVSPGNRGVPDRLVILPNGRTVYVEMKATGKSLDPLQRKWAEKLKKLGHEVYTLDSVESIDSFVAGVQADGV